MAEALKDCDIIMKGGITSGVVYPRAILRMSEHYRFRSIGGTSAGAIAAVITAAAEYNRDGGGYEVIKQIPDEVQTKLKTLFQPSASLRTVFDTALLVLDKKYPQALLKLCCGYWPYFVAGLAASAIAAIVAAMFGSYFGALLLVLIGGALGVGLLAVAVVVITLRDLKDNDFGFCPGRTQPGRDDPALSDWLADRIEMAAGRMTKDGPKPDRPLTFGDIWAGKDGTGSTDKRVINLRMMTTNLSLRRPNALPAMDGNHYFTEAEFAKLFPDWIVKYLVEKAEENEIARRSDPKGDDKDPDPPGFHRFPANGDLPLVVAARMSLSFPILFTTVPLHRHDYPHEDKKAGTVLMQKMLFSDGGLSSNFPVHFFDALLPRHPTFGISLEEFDEVGKERRVHLPMKRGGIWLDYLTVKTLPNFLMSLVNAAKDWQDRLQSTLPGYRERITSVYLKDTEGGLNLTMPEDTIKALGGFGDRAGALMTGTGVTAGDEDVFDFKDHRWRRYLVGFARLEETLEQAAASWNRESDSTRDFIKTYMVDEHASYKSPLAWRQQVFDRFDAIMKQVSEWKQPPLRTVNEDYIPRPATNMRITPVP